MCWSPAPGTYYAPLAELDFDKARRNVDAHLLLPLQVARSASAPGKVRPEARCSSWVAPVAAAPAAGRAHHGAHGRASRSDGEPRARARAHPRQPDRGRVRRHAPVGIAARRPAGGPPGAPPRDVAHRPRRRPRRRCRPRRPPDGEHGGHGCDLRHRRRSATRPGLSSIGFNAPRPLRRTLPHR